MKTINLILTFLSVTAGSIPSSGQNPQSTELTWHAIEVTDLQTNTTKPTTCHFVTGSDNAVVWVQKNGTLTTTFSITGVTGSWESITQPGQIQFSAQRNGKNSTIKLERTGDGLFVTMDFSQPGQFTSILKFRIESVE